MEKFKTLKNGVTIPSIGLGVFKAENGDEAKNSVLYGLKNGYRHIDTAISYRNEESVGDALVESTVDRKEVFVTTKISVKAIRSETAREVLLESFDKLKTDYIDLVLLHWPVENFAKAWEVLEEFYEAGKLKAIGVSNFQIHHLEELAKTAKIMPMVNQIEINPQFPNKEVSNYCFERGIVVEGWSPLGGGKENNLIINPLLVKLGEKYNKSAVQVMIRWSLQNGNVVLPKSVKENRIIDNMNVFDFELSEEDMKEIATLDLGIRTGSDPDNIKF